jgi:hypothetical protein
MNNTNGFHPPSASTAYHGSIGIFLFLFRISFFLETSKRLPSTSSTSSTSSNSTTTTNKGLKSQLVHETRTMKKHKNKKSNESNKKRLQHNDSNNNSTKKIKQSPHLFSHPIIHHHQKKSASQSENIPSSTDHHHRHHHHHHHHRHVINNDHCDSCGELYGEMISCDTCPATFHLLCANPPLSRENVPKGSYFCENCRTKTAEEKTNVQISKSFLFDPKTKLNINGFKKNSQPSSTLGQMKLPTGNDCFSFLEF